MKPFVLPGVRLPAWLLFIATILLSALISASASAQTVLRQINAGGGAVAPFAADNSFDTGNMFSSGAAINLGGVTNPAPQAVYQSVRWAASFNYTLSGLTAGGSYQVRLHFSELSFNAAGQRTFNVAINGTNVLSNFDIFAAVGQNHGLMRQFNATANASGVIVLAFTRGTADNPSIAGIELLNNSATFALTVTNGSGGGNYAAGTAVAIAANAPPAGQTFSGWTGGTPANFANASAASTTYTTTAAAQTVVANYSTTPTGSNLAVGKPISASSSNSGFPVTNANDNSVTTYWESASLPATLTVDLGANANVTAVVVKLNPDPSWGNRSQTIQVLGHNQSTSTFTSLVAAASYAFSPSSGNSVTIPVTTTASQMQLSFTTNSGAPGAQVAEFQILGSAAPNPDFTITALTSTPASPIETNAITLNATVKNNGTVAAAATSVNFYIGSTQVGTAAVGALGAGATGTVSANIGTLTAGGYTAGAKVNESKSVVELDYTNNSITQAITVAQAPGPDLQVLSITPSTSNPAAGVAVTFSVAVNNRGTTAVAAGTTTRLVVGGTTLTQSATPAIAIGQTVSVTIPGSWTLTNGNTAMTATADATNIITETSETNNTLASTISAGRGAIVAYDLYEAENGTPAGGAVVVGQNRTVGDRAGEASGRKAVVLSATGQSVSWTTRASTNTIVVRFSIPDGTSTTLGVFNGATQVGTVNLVSQYAWLYGNETSIPYAQSGTGPRKIYDEANAMLTQTVPAGSTLSVRNTTGADIAVDFVQLELATASPNPNPATFITVTGSDQAAIQTAITTANNTASAVGIFIPTGNYAVTSKIDVTQKSLQIVGAGPWFTRLIAPQGSANTETGFNISGAGATGSQFRNFGLFGNWNNRIDGQGQPFQLTNVSNLTLDNLWVQHFVVMVWGQNVDNCTFTNNRISDTFADGITLANDSQGNLLSNCVAHSTGDDSFALFNAQDVHAGINQNNVYQNLTSICTWRAAGIAVYGGGSNTFRNLYIADSLVYSGVTVSSLSFNISFIGFSSTTTLDNISVVRCGGHFWPNAQIWPAVWLQSAEGAFQGIRISNLDIDDPTYQGIMFQTKVGLQTFTDTTLTNVTINRANTPRADNSNVDATAVGFSTIPSRTGIAVYANPLPEPGQGPAIGTVSFVNLTMTNDSFGIVNTCPNFTINVSNSNTFPLTVTNGTGGGNFAAGTVVNIVANAPAAGQVFAGWTGGTAANFGNTTSASTTYTTTGAAQTITATYNTVPTFALTVSSGSGGGNYAANTIVNIVANAPPAGQVFAGWTGGTAANFGNAAAASTTYKTTGAAQTITATYTAAQTFALTVSSGAGSGNYVAGSVVNIVANTPPAGQVFAGWTGGTAANFGNAASASTTYTTTSGAQTITATFSTVQTFALTVTNGSGGGTYVPNTIVNITANTPPAGQIFSGWTGGTAVNFGNASASSTTYKTASSAQTIVANYTTSSGSNLAVGKPITASSATGSFIATNANDNSLTTYWESAGFPGNLDVNLGANAVVTQVVVKLNPDPAWGARTQTIAVWGHAQDSSTFVLLSPATLYQFTPPSNTATINLSTPATASAVRLVISTNSGAPGGQVAEFQVIGSPAPNPDLTITALTWSPASPIETSSITLNATVKNNGNAASPATTVAFYLGGTQIGSTVPVGTLAAGASVVVSSNIGALVAGSYIPSAEVDPSLSVVELDNTNNVFTSSTAMIVSQAPGPDLQILSVSPSNSNPAVGSAVSFTVAVNNRGTTAAAAGTTTRLLVGGTTLNQTATPAIPANSTVTVTIPGTWTAVTGTSNITATADATSIVTETNETNNVFTTTILSGRGAAMPYTRYRAADTTSASLAGGATRKTSANFDVTQVASQASGQAYVELSSSGSSVQWTVAQNNVSGVTMRFTLPDTADGMGQSASVNCIVTRAGVATTQAVSLTSYYAWQYFLPGEPADSSPGTPTINSNGVPTNIAAFAFDETHWVLSAPMNAGDTIRIQSTGGPVVGVDFLEIETVPAMIAPPAGSVSVTSFGASTGAADNLTAFNNAVTAALASSNKTLFIPAGTYKLSSMWVVGDPNNPIANLTIIGAGMWYTNIQFTNSQAFGGGVSFKMAATGTMDFSNIYLNSNLRSRFSQQAVYKCFMDEFGTGSKIHDIWEEHFECGFWVGDYHHTPAHAADGLLIQNSRIRNNLADGVNFCQGTKNSTVQNCSIRNNGDDGLAVWPDFTNNAPEGVNDTFTHNTIEFIWRSAGIAIYGGSGHKATFNTITDGFMSAGIRLNGTFPGFHFENNTGITFSDTTITNCGSSWDVFTGELGAINLEASGGHSIRNLTFTNIDVVNAQKDGFQMGESGGFSGIQFTNCSLAGSGRDGVTHSKFSSAHLGAAIFTYGPGAATFTHFTFSNAAGGEILNPVGFVLNFN